MNLKTNGSAILLPLCLFFMIAITTLPHSKVHPVAIAQDQQDQKDECEKAHPWQHKVNGECVDKPGVCRNCGQPEGYDCWVECLCREGQYPADDSCSPCTKVGTVCAPH